MTPPRLRIGTRGSRLALVQTEQVAAQLKAAHPETEVEVVTVKTPGDVDRRTALAEMGGYGVFTKTIETELLEGRIDLAVHSAKDLPATMADGLHLAAVPGRAACEDAWLSREGLTLQDTPPGAAVGTSSPRRRALVLNLRPDLDVREVRGNVETRLRKLAEGEYDALLMARAGLERIGLQDRITETLDPTEFLPAPGQGSLIVQARSADNATRSLARAIDDPEAHRCLEVERLLLRRLAAGCSAAVGGWARMESGPLRLSAVVLDKDGTRRLFASGDSASVETDTDMVNAVVADLIDQGASELIEKMS